MSVSESYETIWWIALISKKNCDRLFSSKKEVWFLGDFSKHPSVLKLRKKLSLDSLCGYLVLLRKGAVPLQGKDTEQDENMTASKDPRFASLSLFKSLYSNDKDWATNALKIINE